MDQRAKVDVSLSKKWKRKPRPSQPLVCHFCSKTWDCHNKCFVCPRCYTVYNPRRRALLGIGGELRVARIKEGLTQIELAKQFGIPSGAIRNIETGKWTLTKYSKSKILREKLRIWIDGTKSPIDRRKEMDEMFNSLKITKRRKKEPENGRENTE